ncbi:hypothetical protein PAPYR_3225 [Paratrimastix pyriformis]|uniref:Uncharacterized protein n=1 Tax=Paratrimastix pyriformis TaxID=342808 RepID=A0ABQ8UN28_9EUKA|nr:hypothetical protein PAPYR_3225 [Paratrimastix pyriformis]
MKSPLFLVLFVAAALAAPRPRIPAGTDLRQIPSLTFKNSEFVASYRGTPAIPRIMLRPTHPSEANFQARLNEITCFNENTFSNGNGTWVCASPEMPIHLSFGNVMVHCDGPTRDKDPYSPIVWPETCYVTYELTPFEEQPKQAAPNPPQGPFRMRKDELKVKGYRVFDLTVSAPDGRPTPIGLIYRTPSFGVPPAGQEPLLAHFIDHSGQIVLSARKIGDGPIEVYTGTGTLVGTVERSLSGADAPYILRDGNGVAFAQSVTIERFLGLARDFVFSRIGDSSAVIARLTATTGGTWDIDRIDPTQIDPRVACIIGSMIKFRSEAKDDL